MGYFEAGFDVEGVDIDFWGRYPFTYHRGDVFLVGRELLTSGRFDAVHASPPCKVHTVLKHMAAGHHTDILPAVRTMLVASGLPYVIENVPGAPLVSPKLLCGSMFGLPIQRHRLFETNWPLTVPNCDHEGQRERSPGYRYERSHGRVTEHNVISIHGTGGHGVPLTERRAAMGIDWMSARELAQAIPPAYTHYIGRQLMDVVTMRNDLAA